jgi:DNA-directed RNA polymerase specialized sigma subunit
MGQLLLTYSPKKFGGLTDLVLEYQKTKKQLLLLEVYKKTKRLVWGVVSYYGMLNYPPIVVEDIVDDCRSLVLVKAVDRYDYSRGAKFETFYTWWLRSHVLSRKGYYVRRQKIMLTPSIDEIPNKEYLFKEQEEEKELACFSESL